MEYVCAYGLFCLTCYLSIYLTCLLALCLSGVDVDGREGHVVRFYEGVLGGLGIASVLSSCIVSGERMWEADGRCGWLGRVTKGKGRQHCFFLLSFSFAGIWVMGAGDGNGSRIWSLGTHFSSIMHAEVVFKDGSLRVHCQYELLILL